MGLGISDPPNRIDVCRVPGFLFHRDNYHCDLQFRRILDCRRSSRSRRGSSSSRSSSSSSRSRIISRIVTTGACYQGQCQQEHHWSDHLFKHFVEPSNFRFLYDNGPHLPATETSRARIDVANTNYSELRQRPSDWILSRGCCMEPRYQPVRTRTARLSNAPMASWRYALSAWASSVGSGRSDRTASSTSTPMRSPSC